MPSVRLDQVRIYKPHERPDIEVLVAYAEVSAEVSRGGAISL